MNKAVLCIGSNVDDAIDMIGEAVNALSRFDCFVLAASDIYQVSAPYYNLVLRVATESDFDSLVKQTKTIEVELGRTPEMKRTGVVPIDIDVVVFNDSVMRPRDYAAPYFGLGFRSLR